MAPARASRPLTRRLSFEPLEPRQLLAAVTVSNHFDTVNGDTSSIAALIATPGADGISLREAVLAANTSDEHDVVTFAAHLSGQTIMLSGTEIYISEEITIDARPLAQNVIINANLQSRIFRVDGEVLDNEVFTLAGLTITGGRTSGASRLYSGGGIHASGGDLIIEDCHIAGNSVAGEDDIGSVSGGGGIYSNGDLFLRRSTVSGNWTTGTNAHGGGIYCFDLFATDSVISGNSTRAPDEYGVAHGGGIFAAFSVTLRGTTISGNSTQPPHEYGFSQGGGVYINRILPPRHSYVIDSVITGNTAGGVKSWGGGIASFAPLSVQRSIISDNRTDGADSRGGGIWVRNDIELIDSVVTGNRTLGDRSDGGGIAAIRYFYRPGVMRGGEVTLTRSTVSNNFTRGVESTGGGIHGYLVDLNNSTVSDNWTEGDNSPGGGIYAEVLDIHESTISGNHTEGANSHGGGTATKARVLVDRSTISGNRTLGSGAMGGGAWAGSFAQLWSSTISGNSTSGSGARGGGIATVTWAQVHESTVTNNSTLGANAGGGGIAIGTTIDLRNSILAGNFSPSGAIDLYRPVNGSITANFSLLGVGITPNLGGNNINTNTPGLTPLSHHGGLTQTHALLADSPALDHGNPVHGEFGPDFDQRGAPFERVFGGRIDIGAYERQVLPAEQFVVNFWSDRAVYGDDQITLREAVNAANGSIGPDTITFAPVMAGKTIDFAFLGKEMLITEELSIDARPLLADVTIDADQNSRIFNITAAAGNFFFGGLTLIGGLVTGHNAVGETTFSGGAIRSLSLGSLTLDQVTLRNNRTQGNRARGGAIFSVGNVSLIDSTVSGNSTSGVGASGGGVFSAGTVSLTRGMVRGNSTAGELSYGGGIHAGGNVSLSSSTVTGNATTANNSRGGGLWVYGNSFIFASTVSGNTTAGTNARGGGIYIAGDLSQTTIERSTISGNSTTGSGASGGGIAAPRGVMMWLNISTLSGNRTTGANSPGGGLWASGGTFDLSITQSTVTANQVTQPTSTGGGIFQVNTASNFKFAIENSIVAGNTSASTGADVVKDPESALAVNYSLVGTGVVPTSGANNIPTNSPNLGPLADNGGPAATHALPAGHQAIDAGNPAVAFNPLEPDQRGAPFVRVFNGDGSGGARLDIGAYERQTVSSLPLVVSTLADESDGNYAAGDLSLREAIGLANGNAGALDTITFAPSLFAAGAVSMVLHLGQIAIQDSLTINGPSPVLLTLDASGNDPTPNVNNGDGSRVFDISGSGTVTINGLTFTGGDLHSGDGAGGAIRSASNLFINASVFRDNSAIDGGAIVSTQALTIDETSFIGNSAIYGGAISHNTFNLTITGSTFSANSANQGGAILAETLIINRVVTITNSTVSGNSAAQVGGGIFNGVGKTVIRHSTITGNAAPGGAGGGVATRVANSLVQVHSSIISGNLSGGDVVFVDGATNPFESLNFNVVGNGNGLPDFFWPNDQWSTDPMLGPLTDNGGSTHTHAPLLLPNSPVIDRGDPNALAGGGAVPLYDQRGTPFTRVFNGDGIGAPQIDIGAFEVQSTLAPQTLPGDYNRNGIVDAADVVVWRNTRNQVVTPYSGADGDGDGTIDQDDYNVWRANFGRILPPPSGSGGVVRQARPDANPAGAVNSTALPSAASQPEVTPLVASDARSLVLADFGLVPREVYAFAPERSTRLPLLKQNPPSSASGNSLLLVRFAPVVSDVDRSVAEPITTTGQEDVSSTAASELDEAFCWLDVDCVESDR